MSRSIEEDKVDIREQTETEDNVLSGEDPEADDLERDDDDDYHVATETTRGGSSRKSGLENRKGEANRKLSKAHRKTQAGGGGQRQGTHQRSVKTEETSSAVCADVSAVYPLPSLQLELDRKRKAADRETQNEGEAGEPIVPPKSLCDLIALLPKSDMRKCTDKRGVTSCLVAPIVCRMVQLQPHREPYMETTVNTRSCTR